MAVNFTDFQIDQKDLEVFTGYQKTLFFSKADGVYPLDILKSHQEEHEQFIREILRKKLETEVTGITELTRRTLHYVYKIETDKGNYIIRINAAGEFYRELSFITEAWVMRELSYRSLPHVNVYAVDVSRKIAPFDYEIMDFCPHDNLFDYSQKQEMPVNILGQLGALVATVHEIRTGGFGPIDVGKLLDGSVTGVHQKWSQYVTSNLVTHIESLVILGTINYQEAGEIQNALACLKSTRVDRPVFLHGDLANHNVFIASDKIHAIIDWEDCISGDPIFDVAYFGSACFGREEWFKAFLAGYKSISPLPTDFEQRCWPYYLRISLSKAILRERFELKHNTYLPPARERILHALDKIRNGSPS